MSFCPAHLKTEHLVDQHHRDAPGGDLPVDNDNLVHRTAYAIRSLGAGVFEAIRVFVDAEETFFEVAHDLLRPDDENDASGALRTVIPFASRAATVRFTRGSSATVPNRRLIDGSRLGSSSLIT